MSTQAKNSLPLKTQYRIAAWFLAAVSGWLILLLVESALNIPFLHATREDLPRREYTFVSMRVNQDPEDGRRTYLLTVEEEDLPLRIPDLMDSPQLRSRLEGFEAGDRFYCYVDENSASLETVEMGVYTYVAFYTLEEYQAELAGSLYSFLAIGGVILVLSVGSSVWCFVKARRCGRETPAIEEAPIS
ncbi:MAG: hypothetical protein IJ363_04810 [Clostridia bacterium]|nr:hypothetical protein [Clostridia bacterium]